MSNEERRLELLHLVTAAIAAASGCSINPARDGSRQWVLGGPLAAPTKGTPDALLPRCLSVSASGMIVVGYVLPGNSRHSR